MLGFTAFVATAAVAGCGTASTVALTSALPRAQDAPAPHDYYRELTPAASKCRPAVPVLTPAEVGGRTYHELGSLSASCYPGAPAVCKRTLSESACEHHADAAVLTDSSADGSPPGASGQSQVSMSARAVRWQASPSTP